MKKLMMIAAVAAVAGGVFASPCDEAGGDEDCLAYKVKFTFKTLLLKTVTLKQDCGDKDCCGYFKQGTRKIEGILWTCDGGCTTLNIGTMNDDFNFVAWDSTLKYGMTSKMTPDTNSVWKAVQGDLAAVNQGLEFKVFDRYEQKATKVEAALRFTSSGSSDICAAGFGSWSKKFPYVKSISGNAVGILALEEGQCSQTSFGGVAYDFCEDVIETCFDLTDKQEGAAASGTWSMKYFKLKSIDVPGYAAADAGNTTNSKKNEADVAQISGSF